jgi:hypothetical protein
LYCTTTFASAGEMPLQFAGVLTLIVSGTLALYFKNNGPLSLAAAVTLKLWSRMPSVIVKTAFVVHPDGATGSWA